jgi:hypothetical protein
MRSIRLGCGIDHDPEAMLEAMRSFPCSPVFHHKANTARATAWWDFFPGWFCNKTVTCETRDFISRISRTFHPNWHPSPSVPTT